jgi:cytochrome bd ubiquinol oxidase subunit I
MVGIGTALVFLGLWGLFVRWRRRDYANARWFLRAAAAAGFGSVIALECGWIVTEVGRQPWVVYKILRTADAVTHAPGVQTTFIGVVILYTALGVATLFALRALRRRWAAQDAAAGGRALGDVTDESIPYGPHQEPGGPAR